MTYSIFQINSKKTVLSAHNNLLRRSFLILSLLLSVTASYADNVDFNTALATSSMFGLAKEINIYYQAVTSREGVVCQEAIAEVKRIFKFMTDVIGVLEKAWEGNTGANAAEYEELMQVILSVRQACREQKQWALADCIRDRLAEIGITIEDSPQGARWKKREV